MLICTNEDCGTENRDEATYCTRCGHLLLKVVGDYRVLDLIGQGANGAVYRAEHRQRPGEVRAIKAVFKRADIASLKAEFEVLKDLHHPNLPRYDACFEYQGYGYLVMEFVPGQNLELLLAQRRGPLSPTLVLGYALQLCDVLTFLHTQPQRILHRDLKPANIRLTHTDVVKLVDFGLLKQGTDATRQTQRGRGTLAYMPIEQHGSGTDARSDLYSLGATLYHLLTGHEPPAAADRVTTTLDSLPPPCQINSALSPYVAAVVVHAMSRLKDDRYPDVASFKAALLHADAQPFQSGSSAPLPGHSSAGASTLVNVPLPPAPIALRDLWLEATQAYVLERWAHAEALLTRVAALKPDYEDVQSLLADAHVRAECERGYAQMQVLRAADAWPQVVDLFAKLPSDYPDPQQHRPWAAARQRYAQHYEAALHAGKNKAWRTMLDHLTVLLAEAPGDAAAITLQAHAQRKEAERIRRLLPAMVEVPAGPFLMGSTDQQFAAAISQGVNANWVKLEKPQHTLTLPRYWIGKTPVTNAQFRPFVESDGYTNQAYWTIVGWQWREQARVVKPEYWDDVQFNGADYPVVGVNWFEAVAYCRWLSQQTGIAFRLPTEAEWEKAARGPDGRIYPWGNFWEVGRCNSGEANIECTTPVGTYPTGASPYGALDMAGNVWEWCMTKSDKRYPYQFEDEWQAVYVEADENRRIRGGSFYMKNTSVRGASRDNFFPHFRYFSGGLRVASHVPVPGSDS